MPRFYLHIRHAEHLIEDHEGSDLPDLATARAEALDAARAICSALVRAGGIVDGRYFEIEDEKGNFLAIVPFRDAVRLP